jgi:hypothetical protein
MNNVFNITSLFFRLKKSLVFLAGLALVILLTACGRFSDRSAEKPATVPEKTVETISPGVGKWILSTDFGPLPVYYYRPARWQPDQPVFILLHGEHRNALALRNALQDEAEKRGILLVCPFFSKETFSGSRSYALGGMLEKRKVAPETQWFFPILNRLRDSFLEAAGAPQAPVTFFGHSAGAQLLHRYLFFGKARPHEAYIVANAGWYTMPDSSTAFPYGLGGVPAESSFVKEAFGFHVTILLGEADTKADGSLRQTVQAQKEGKNRLERGTRFFEQSRKAARMMQVPFAWQMKTVPAIGHDTEKMARAAMELIKTE